MRKRLKLALSISKIKLHMRGRRRATEAIRSS